MYVETYADMVDETAELPAEIPEIQLDEFRSASPLPQVPVPTTAAPDPTLDPVEPKDSPSTEDSSEPPLDPELLSALGAGTSDTPEFGDNIHISLANLWPPILRKGLSKEDKERLMKEYLIPSNCKLLQAPRLNAEISAAVSEVVRGRDKKLVNFQQELGTGLSAVNRGMDTLLKTDNKTAVLKHLSDGCRALSDLHYCFTKDRMKLILPSLEKSFLHVIQDSERDETLFGNSLAEKIKACKAIEKQGIQIRNKINPKIAPPQAPASRPFQQGNWNGPPRYAPNRGGRGGRGRAPPSASRRHYPPTTAQSTSKGSNQSKTRASAQQ